jgi:hypothetical protein
MSWINFYEQSVNPETPPTGYGTIYVKTDGNLNIKTDDGNVRTVSALFYVANGSSTQSTTSTSYSAIADMSIVLPAGTFVVFFNASASQTLTNLGYISIFVDGVQEVDSERTFHAESLVSGHSHDMTHIVNICHKITLVSSATVTVRYKVGGGTMTVTRRTLLIHEGA